MQAPGVCFICESTPPEDQAIYDTLRNFDAGVVIPLNGRKYICKGCVSAAAEEFNFISTEAADNAVKRGAESEARLASVVNYVTAVSEQLNQENLETAGNTAPLFARQVADEAEAAVVAELEAIVDVPLEEAAKAVKPVAKKKPVDAPSQ